jgi:hypothetical protein
MGSVRSAARDITAAKHACLEGWREAGSGSRPCLDILIHLAGGSPRRTGGFAGCQNVAPGSYEEFRERGCRGLWGDVVGLAGERSTLAVGEHVRERSGSVAQQGHALLAIDHQGRRFDGGDQLGREREISDDLCVVEEGVGDRLQRWAEGRVAQLGDDVGGDPDRLGLVELDGVASPARGDQRVESLWQIRRERRAASVDDERRLIQR